MASPVCFTGAHANIQIYSHGNIKTQNINEDSAAIIQLDTDHLILVVADGLGGHAHGAEASKYVIEKLRNDIINNDTDTLTNRIIRSLESSNETILKWNMSSGTTIAIAEILNNRVRTYHCGDSEIVMCGSRGRICLKTTAHSPVGYSLESGSISEKDAMLHPDRHFISNYLGHRSMHITVSKFKTIKPRDTLLLATDGLFDNFMKDEIITIIRQQDLDTAALDLKQQTHFKMIDFENHIISKPDDMTFILFRLNH